VVAGKKPSVQLTPSSRLVAQPMSLEPPLNTRPVWNVATTVDPNANVSGSTSVACAAVGVLFGANGSELICVTVVCACAGAATANAAVTTAANKAMRIGDMTFPVHLLAKK
jgi:hypothetical protein